MKQNVKKEPVSTGIVAETGASIYEKPTLVRFGTVTKLTFGAAGSGMDGECTDNTCKEDLTSY